MTLTVSDINLRNQKKAGDALKIKLFEATHEEVERIWMKTTTSTPWTSLFSPDSDNNLIVT